MKGFALLAGFLAVAVALVALPATSGAAEATTTLAELVQLTMTERGNVDRVSEHVTFGVPLPEGTSMDAKDLALLDLSGGVSGYNVPTPCQFLVLARWPKDRSVKWVLLDFNTDVKAGQVKRLMLWKLVKGRPMVAVPNPLSVNEDADSITVVTGPLKFVVLKKNFNLLDQAWLNGQMVIKSHNRGIVVKADPNLHDGRKKPLDAVPILSEFLASRDSNCVVEVEEKGPQKVIIRAEGKQLDAQGNRAGDYVVRIYAYANQPVVRVDYSFVNRQGERSNYIAIRAINIEIPTVLRSPSFLMGGEKDIGTGKLGKDDVVAINYKDSDNYTLTLSGKVVNTGKGKTTKPLTTGWGSLDDGKVGLAAGLRWFWQMHPKELSLSGAGTITLGLWPESHPLHLEFYTGESRTHSALLYFHNGKESAETIQAKFVALQKPLRPLAPPRWYCRDTKAFDKVTEADPSLYLPEYRKLAEEWEAKFAKCYERIDRFRDHRELFGRDFDAYNFFRFGEGIHWFWEGKTDGTPMMDIRCTLGSGNYYGFPHMMCLQFVRTGREEYFDLLDTHALQMGDVHYIHYDPQGLAGGSRYCPPTDHVRGDSLNIYFGWTFYHQQSQSVFERYYFTGDRRSLDHALLATNYADKYTKSDRVFSNPRNGAHHLAMLVAAYYLTLDKHYLDRSKTRINYGMAEARSRPGELGKIGTGSQRYQSGLLNEGFIDYYLASGDPEALTLIKLHTDFLANLAKPFRGTSGSSGYAFMYAQTGEEKYLKLALECLANARDSYGNPWKDFAMNMRNAPLALYYLTTVGQAEVKKE